MVPGWSVAMLETVTVVAANSSNTALANANTTVALSGGSQTIALSSAVNSKNIAAVALTIFD